jgi:hypothetical protein
MLPIYQTNNQLLMLMQNKWSSEINPVLALPTSSPSFLTGISVVSGPNKINHLLGRTPQGWIITDTNSNIVVYRSQPFNDLTLTLTSSGSGVISLMVF